MRLRLASLVLCSFGAAVVWACSLNPQPFPPEDYDASKDGALAANPDAAGGMPDSSTEDGTTPQGGDAAADATEDADASEASDGDAGDASDDASDGRDDAGDGETE